MCVWMCVRVCLSVYSELCEREREDGKRGIM